MLLCLGFQGISFHSAANLAQFWWMQAGLAVLFSRQLLNGSKDFFLFNIFIFIYFFKYKTIETHARAFLPLNISAVGSVFVNQHHKSVLQKEKRNIFFGQSSVILAIVATVKAYPVHSHSFICLNTPRYFIRKLTFKVFSRFFSKLVRHFLI